MTFTLRLFLIITLLTGIARDSANAQTFVRLDIDPDPSFLNAISWVDYDNDGDLDFLVSAVTDPANRLFRNDGNDVFVRMLVDPFISDTIGTVSQTWADYDNDGDVDVYLANANAGLGTTNFGSMLYRNEGSPNYDFVRITDGDIGAVNTIGAFGGSWGDYDNDGFVDLFLATPTGIAYPGDTLANVFFLNNGDGTFERDTVSNIVNGPFAPYTIPTWSDFDLDGDLDLSVTNGPVTDGQTLADYLWENQLVPGGSATFIRDTVGSHAVQQRDGQQINWIDYDNDGDLDFFATNWGGTPVFAAGMKNDLYRNDSGQFSKITVGSLVNDIKISLGQTWGDFDNDGDLDVYVCNGTSFNNLGGNDYYRNNGAPDYTFTKVGLGSATQSSKSGWGASAGDYDNDGDLDLYVGRASLTAAPETDPLYRNDLTNGNNWVILNCVGVASNRSAIGAKVRVKATVLDNTYWQFREISAQNAATGQNSLRAHFGLGDAAVIDSLVIEWPGGATDDYAAVTLNRIYAATEGVGLDPLTSIQPTENLFARRFFLAQNFPNPFNPSTTIQYSLADGQRVRLAVFDLLGHEVAVLVDGFQPAGKHSLLFEPKGLSSGIYVYRLETAAGKKTRKLSYIK